MQCPQRNFHSPMPVARERGDRYRCTCGCRFEWRGATDWKILRDGRFFPEVGDRGSAIARGTRIAGFLPDADL